ncbi:hypothetical protein AK88_01378 [Plasmodium fragile]|uniref:Uncharacterized protein n=1 Tax=Plasmodium fragile TaxID=5857 RepID=A0A0D9QP98_PLAFR|nr:uncharacterized protein AK88_01378 [Plasmodium fragile]KJP88884.1 hypothetical protein AK88_01378 [Plasmodium fragile]
MGTPEYIDFNSYAPQIETIVKEAFKSCVAHSQKACQRDYIPAVVIAVLIFNALVYFGHRLGRNVIYKMSD